MLSGLLLALVLLLTTGMPAGNARAADSHAEAVELARQGRHAEALVLLESLYREDPSDQGIINDLIAVRTWAGRYEQAAALYGGQAKDRLPLYVHEAAVNAYRQLGQKDRALAITEQVLRRDPGNEEFRKLRLVLLIETQQFRVARRMLETFADSGGKDSEYYRWAGRIASEEEDWLQAFAAYFELRRMAPRDEEAVHRQFYALLHIRAPEAAEKLLRENAEMFDDSERALLLLNQAAQLLRWSGTASLQLAEAERLALRALALQLRALDLLSAEKSAGEFPDHVLYDLMVTLRNLGRMKSVDRIYRSLVERRQVPSYVTNAGATARLANKRPEEAGELYRSLLTAEGDDYDYRIGRFYSLIEEENFTDAYDLIDAMHAAEPLYQQTRSRPPYPNNRYLDLDVTSLQARYYGDQLETAWRRADELVRNAPANNWLWEVRGQIANARQWHNQALYDYHYASLLDPASLDARIGTFTSLLNLYRYREARQVLQTIRQEYPRETRAEELYRMWEVSRKPLYFGDIVWGQSSGAEIDGRSLEASAEIISGPLDDQLFLDLFYRYSWAEIPEGEERFERYSLGLDYRLPDWLVMGRITHNNSTIDEFGGSLSLTWSPDDFWQASLAVERFSLNTPLRALFYSIRADSLSSGLRYRWSEKQDLSLRLAGLNFTDGNDRIEAGAAYRLRLLDIPHFDLDGRIEAYGSTNSREDAPYFNPESDFSLQGAVHLEHIYWRRYDLLLAHDLDVGYGIYAQKKYDAKAIGHIRYQQRLKLNPWVEALLSYEYGRNVYDGETEPYHLVRFMISGKI